MASNSPIAPSRTSSRARLQSGCSRYMNASISATPAERQPSTMCCASAELMASGFSQRTCLPAAAARNVHGACRWFGRGM